MDISIDNFYDEFISDDANFGLPEFYKNVQMFRDVSHQCWKKNQKIINLVVPVVGVPFISSTRATVTVNLQKKLENKIVLDIDTKTIDAPYSDTFSSKEAQIVVGDKNRCLFLQVFKIDFVKSTMFRSKITGRAEQGMVEAAEKWHQRAKRDGHFEAKSSKMKKRSSIITKSEVIKVQEFESPNDVSLNIIY